MRTIWIVILVLAVSLAVPVHFAFACGGDGDGGGGGPGGTSKFAVKVNPDSKPGSSGISKVPGGTNVRKVPYIIKGGPRDPATVDKDFVKFINFLDADSVQKDTKSSDGLDETLGQLLGEMVTHLLLTEPGMTPKEAFCTAIVAMVFGLWCSK